MAQRVQRVALGATPAIVVEPLNVWRRITLSLAGSTGGPAYLGFGPDVASTNAFALPVASIVDVFLEPNIPLWAIRGTAGDVLTFIEYTRSSPFQA